MTPPLTYLITLLWACRKLAAIGRQLYLGEVWFEQLHNSLVLLFTLVLPFLSFLHEDACGRHRSGTGTLL